MAGTGLEIVGVVLVSLLRTFLGGTNVDLIALEADGLLHDQGKNPGATADAGPLEGKADDEEDVGEGVGEEGNGEGGGDKLPRDGSEDGGNEGTKETGVEEVLDGVGHTKGSPRPRRWKGGDTSNNEEAGDDAKLTANHEAGKVAALALEEEIAGLLGKVNFRARPWSSW